MFFRRLIFWLCAIIGITILYFILSLAIKNREQNVTPVQQRITNTINQPSQLEKIIEQKELRVGVIRSVTRLYTNYRNPGKIGGFDFSLLNRFAQSLNIKIKIIEVDSMQELHKKLENNEIDLITDDIRGYTNIQEKVIKTIPYRFQTQQLVYLKGTNKPYSFDNISENELIIAQYSSQQHILNQLKAEYSQLTWTESPLFNKEELLKLVADKEILYTISDALTIKLMQRIYPRLTVAFTVVESYPIHWYVKCSNDRSLVEKINQFINKAVDDETVQLLEKRYFNYMQEFDFVDTRAFLNAIEDTLPTYIDFFKKYAQKNDLDWRLIAAMAYQESHWDPKAISPTGVRGMMMLTKSTALSLNVKNRLNAEQSIRGGTEYLKQLYNRIPKTIPEDDRIWFALAAYNMGFGHVLDARRLAIDLGKNPNSWLDVKDVLPLLSEEEYYINLKYGQARGYQAYDFVTSVKQYYTSLVGYLLEKQYRQKMIDEKVNHQQDDFEQEKNKEIELVAQS